MLREVSLMTCFKLKQSNESVLEKCVRSLQRFVPVSDATCRSSQKFTCTQVDLWLLMVYFAKVELFFNIQL